MKRLFKTVIVTALLLVTSMIVSAHPEHDFVQASYITLTEDELLLDIDFRPGYEITADVLAAIDIDGDSDVTDAEAAIYADAVTAALRLEIDGQPVELIRLGISVPSVSMLEDGLGIIQLHFSAPLPETTAGDYEVFYENGFAPEAFENEYLVNGFVQRDALDTIDITAQDREWNQQTITLRYSILDAPAANVVADASAPDLHSLDHFIGVVRDALGAQEASD